MSNSAYKARPVPEEKGNIKKRANKLSGTLIGLSSAAVVSVYAIGYVNTHSSSDQVATFAPPAVATAQPPVPNRSGGIAPSAALTPRPVASGVASTYKDGSFVGSGNSRHGGMQVKIVIANGQITSAAVMNCGTRYPCSDINPLLGEVTSRQGVPVDHVSGATDSSNAFKQAVSSALSQAKA